MDTSCPSSLLCSQQKEKDRMNESNEMGMCVLASGSAGNCIWLGTDKTALLIDAGISIKNLKNKLNAIGESIERLSAICLTHEHTDHAHGAIALCQQYKIPLYATRGTINAIGSLGKAPPDIHPFQANHPFPVGDVLVEAFSISHNAVDPVGFTVKSAEGVRVGILLDTGTVTNQMLQSLRCCDALVLEANHDEELLNNSPLPQDLKERISGAFGHLSNDQAAELLTRLKGSRLKQVFLVHLFEPYNSPELAVHAVRRALDGTARITGKTMPRLRSMLTRLFRELRPARNEMILTCVPPKCAGPVWSWNNKRFSYHRHALSMRRAILIEKQMGNPIKKGNQ